MYDIKSFIVKDIEAIALIPTLWENIKANHATCQKKGRVKAIACKVMHPLNPPSRKWIAAPCSINHHTTDSHAPLQQGCLTLQHINSVAAVSMGIGRKGISKAQSPEGTNRSQVASVSMTEQGSVNFPEGYVRRGCL